MSGRPTTSSVFRAQPRAPPHSLSLPHRPERGPTLPLLTSDTEHAGALVESLSPPPAVGTWMQVRGTIYTRNGERWAPQCRKRSSNGRNSTAPRQNRPRRQGRPGPPPLSPSCTRGAQLAAGSHLAAAEHTCVPVTCWVPCQPLGQADRKPPITVGGWEVPG